jgi:hypothetical protein
MEEVDPANDRYRIAVKIFGRSTPVEVSLKQLDYDTSKKPFRFDPGPCPGIPEREYRMVTARNMAFWIKIRDENGRPRSGAEMRHEANELEYEKKDREGFSRQGKGQKAEGSWSSYCVAVKLAATKNSCAFFRAPCKNYKTSDLTKFISIGNKNATSLVWHMNCHI